MGGAGEVRSDAAASVPDEVDALNASRWVQCRRVRRCDALYSAGTKLAAYEMPDQRST